MRWVTQLSKRFGLSRPGAVRRLKEEDQEFTAFVITIEPACHPAMLEETAGILLQDRIWVNTFDRRCINPSPLLLPHDLSLCFNCAGGKGCGRLSVSA